MARIDRSVLVVLTSVAVLALGMLSWLAFGEAQEVHVRPNELTRLSYRFDDALDARAVGRASEAFRRRLKSVHASEISVSAKNDRDLVLEFRPLHEMSVDDLENDRRANLLRRGRLRFLRCAEGDDQRRLGAQIGEEKKKFDAWRREHAQDSPDDFNALEPALGGPKPGLISAVPRPSAAVSGAYGIGAVSLLVPRREWTFGSDDLAEVGVSADNRGLPAVSFEMRDDRKVAFGDFTGSIIGHSLAIVVDGEIVTLATVEDRLPGAGIIHGGPEGFTMREAEDLISILRSGELPGVPRLVSAEHVAAATDSSWIGFAALGGGALIAAFVVIALSVRSYRRPRDDEVRGEWSSTDASAR
jgi:hypothetical protein